jgi:hypothetical protein
LTDDQAQILRLLEALNEGDPVQILRRSLEHDALDWVERGLSYGAGLGLGPEIATPLLFQTLNEIRAVVADRIERESAEARPRRRSAQAKEPSRRGAVFPHAMPA